MGTAGLISGTVCAFDADLGEPYPFDKQMVFAGTVLTSEDDLVYWVEPFKNDEEGNKSVRKYLKEKSGSIYRLDPFILPVALAGVAIPGLHSNNRLTDENYPINSLRSFSSHVYGNSYIFTCYGYYRSVAIPFCRMTDANQADVAESSILKGITILDEHRGLLLVEPEYGKLLTEAFAKAKASEVGIWRPFHFLMSD